MMMSAYDRRLKVLQVAANMKRRLSQKDPVPTAKEVIEYARELDEFVKKG